MKNEVGELTILLNKKKPVKQYWSLRKHERVIPKTSGVCKKKRLRRRKLKTKKLKLKLKSNDYASY